MVGLSPNPYSNVRSLGEQLYFQRRINSHIVAISDSSITFGDYDQSYSMNWLDLQFDSGLQSWTFTTSEMKVNGQIFISSETPIVV